MDALDLIILGRQLARIGERAMRAGGLEDDEPAAFTVALPAGALIVMRDVLAHPGNSITDITARTGLPQSYVSESVNRLRIKGIAEISADPADRRRTLVRLTATHVDQVARHSARDADDLLRIALEDLSDDSARQVIATLTELARWLRTKPAVGTRTAARGELPDTDPRRAGSVDSDGLPARTTLEVRAQHVREDHLSDS
jgi:DNA-binding MarR family transcriptional regulator